MLCWLSGRLIGLNGLGGLPVCWFDFCSIEDELLNRSERGTIVEPPLSSFCFSSYLVVINFHASGVSRIRIYPTL